MKKIIIGTMIVLSGLFAQAATVNWSVNTIQSSPSAAVEANWVVQIYTSDVVYSYDAAKAGEITPWASGETVASGTTFRAKGAGTQGNGTTVNYYAVVYDNSSIADAQHYIVSDEVSLTIAVGGSTANLPFGGMAGTTLATNKFLNSTWEPVPEPTSGLLLFIGGALLALRRKQK